MGKYHSNTFSLRTNKHKRAGESILISERRRQKGGAGTEKMLEVVGEEMAENSGTQQILEN